MLKITVDDKELQEFFKKLQGKLNDLEPAFKIAGQIIVRSVHKNFDVGCRYNEVGSQRGGSNK